MFIRPYVATQARALLGYLLVAVELQVEVASPGPAAVGLSASIVAAGLWAGLAFRLVTWAVVKHDMYGQRCCHLGF